MNTPVTDNGVFDGALLFDGREYRTPEHIVAFAHDADRLGFVKDMGAYFRAEFLCKKQSSVSSIPNLGRFALLNDLRFDRRSKEAD